MTHKERVEAALKAGKEYIVIRDTDNEMYESGFADYLLSTYDYTNTMYDAKVYIKREKHRPPGGEFAEPESFT